MVKLIEEDQVNGDKLRQAREARGWDWSQVARMCSLSVAQVKALENGGVDSFYSLQIKNNAARKVALVLGVSDVLNGSVREPYEAFVEAVTISPATDSLASPGLLRKLIPGSHWMGYVILSFILVLVLFWSGLQMKPSSQEVRFNEIAGTIVQQDSKTSSPRLAEAVSPENAVIPPGNLHPQPVLGPLSATKSTQETEIVPASLTTSSSPACAFEGEVATIEAANPTKSAEKVSLMLHKAGKLCVQDASGKVWQEELKPWMGRTFVGKAPWKLHSPALPNADVYFQGEKLKLTSASARTIALNGKEIQ